jgi:hypothetical protein
MKNSMELALQTTGGFPVNPTSGTTPKFGASAINVALFVTTIGLKITSC